ncbi:MAG: hypothetical protein HQK65_22515 [Desulfamplus sp.]|nr:hypothetical protein [Desulfamplus sp.]
MSNTGSNQHKKSTGTLQGNSASENQDRNESEELFGAKELVAQVDNVNEKDIRYKSDEYREKIELRRQEVYTSFYKDDRDRKKNYRFNLKKGRSSMAKKRRKDGVQRRGLKQMLRQMGINFDQNASTGALKRLYLMAPNKYDIGGEHVKKGEDIYLRRKRSSGNFNP